MKFTSNPTGESLLKMDSGIYITNIITNKKIWLAINIRAENRNQMKSH
jgi:hypothetical protein